MDSANTALILGLLFAVAVVISIYLLFRLNAARKDIEYTYLSGGIATYFLDESDSEKKCAMCLGKIGTDLIAECDCGKIFHESCARPTGQCPYCGRDYERMALRESVDACCPVCGQTLKDGVCACGAAFPYRDGTFVCACGGRVDCDRPLCGRCGALYKKTKVYPGEGNKDITETGVEPP